MPSLAMRCVPLSLAMLALLLSCGGRSATPAQAAAPVDTYKVVNVYPHDPSAYTQGLIYRDGFLFESTGLQGRSTLRKVKLETGEIVRRVPVDARYFAEGLTDWNGELIQLTWQSEIAFVYDMATFASRRTLSYGGEGWGLTHDSRALIMSDGTNSLRSLEPSTLREIRRVSVKDGNLPIRELNELEYIGGEIFANVWHSDRIARISPASGRVMRWIDLHGLMASGYRLDAEAVLNGIAYDPARKRLFVTGKLWPKLFEIQIVRRR